MKHLYEFLSSFFRLNNLAYFILYDTTVVTFRKRPRGRRSIRYGWTLCLMTKCTTSLTSLRNTLDRPLSRGACSLTACTVRSSVGNCFFSTTCSSTRWQSPTWWAACSTCSTPGGYLRCWDGWSLTFWPASGGRWRLGTPFLFAGGTVPRTTTTCAASITNGYGYATSWRFAMRFIRPENFWASTLRNGHSFPIGTFFFCHAAGLLFRIWPLYLAVTFVTYVRRWGGTLGVRLINGMRPSRSVTTLACATTCWSRTATRSGTSLCSIV